MSVFVIADPHLSFSSGKPMDIFRGWSDYTDRLKKNWEAVVSERDTVVLPGDISWAMELSAAAADFAFLNALPGTKIIGKGNHDYWWGTVKKTESFLAENGFNTIKILFNNAYQAENIAVAGTRGWFFDDKTEESEKIILREAGRLRRSLEAAVKLSGEPVAFTHYPVAFNGEVCEPLMQVLQEFSVRRCFFGHIHGAARAQALRFEYGGIDFSLISADYLAFCPKKIM